MNHLTVFAHTPSDPPPANGYVGYINVACAEDGRVRFLVRNRGAARHGDNAAPFADEAVIYLSEAEAKRLASALFEWPFDHMERPHANSPTKAGGDQ